MKTRLSETLWERAWSSPVWIVQGRRAFNIAKVNVNSTEVQGTRLCQKQLNIQNASQGPLTNCSSRRAYTVLPRPLIEKHQRVAGKIRAKCFADNY